MGPEDEAAAAASEEADAAGGLVGRSFGKLGTVVRNPGVRVSKLGIHGADRMELRGVTKEMLDAATINPIVVLQQGANKFLYIGSDAAVVVRSDGLLVTTYPAAEYTPNIEDVIVQAQGP